MARMNHLTKEEVGEMFYALCYCLAETRQPKEAAELLSDLLSHQEAQMIARRLKIAQLMLAGKTYEEIGQETKAAMATVTRVSEWLKLSGEGYRRAVQQLARQSKTKSIMASPFSSDPLSFNIKRRYPQYYWPQLLLEEVVKSASFEQRRKIRSVIGELEKSKQKNTLFRKIKNMLR